MDALLAVLGLKPGAVLSGLLGSLISYRFFREMGTAERSITIISGVPLAVYCGPLIADVLGMSHKGEIGITFLTGALGISILSALVKAMPEIITGMREWLFKR